VLLWCEERVVVLPGCVEEASTPNNIRNKQRAAISLLSGDEAASKYYKDVFGHTHGCGSFRTFVLLDKIKAKAPLISEKHLLLLPLLSKNS